MHTAQHIHNFIQLLNFSLIVCFYKHLNLLSHNKCTVPNFNQRKHKSAVLHDRHDDNAYYWDICTYICILVEGNIKGTDISTFPLY